MLRIFALLLFCMPQVFAADSLKESDFIGSWTNSRPITKGESNALEITDEYGVSFTRSFSSQYPNQSFRTDANGIQFVGDIAIIVLHWESGELAYKLVLSGWSSSQRRVIFGTMYLYRDGNVFNGLPIGFETEN